MQVLKQVKLVGKNNGGLKTSEIDQEKVMES